MLDRSAFGLVLLRHSEEEWCKMRIISKNNPVYHYLYVIIALNFLVIRVSIFLASSSFGDE